MEPLEKLVTNFVMEVQTLRIQELEKQVSELTEEFKRTTKELIMDYDIKCEEFELLKADKLIDKSKELTDARKQIKELQEIIHYDHRIIYNADYWINFEQKETQTYQVLNCLHGGPTGAPLCLECLKKDMINWKNDNLFNGR